MIAPEDFRPPWYLRSGHIQTILTGFHKPKAALPDPIVHRIGISEIGDVLVYENRPCLRSNAEPQVASANGNSFPGTNEAVFLFHGLGSSHRGSYMMQMASILTSRGYRVFRFDLPGAGDSYHYTPLPPHGACSEILWQAIQRLSHDLQITRWRGAGVSLGGNLLLRMLINHADDLEPSEGSPAFRVTKAIAIAPPVDLGRCSDQMGRGVHRIYAQYFLRSLRRQTLIRAERWPIWKDCVSAADFRTIRSFDHTITAPLAGFSSPDEYYHAGSTTGELSRLKTRTTVLIDEHDPIVPYKIFKNMEWSPTTDVRVTRRGGHIGYLQRNQRGDEPRYIRWSDAWGVSELLSN